MAHHYLGFGPLTLVLALVTPGQAHARQAAPAAEAAAESTAATDGLQDIVVTAQKRSESLQRVPIAVSAFTGEVLASGGIEAAVSLPRLTPGLAVNSSGAFSSPYIRGVGTQYASLGLESSVATYYNGVYLSRPVSGLLSFNDLERIEVLKGPQGTLYGRNAAAGAIQIVTKDPVQRFEGNLMAVGGNYSTYGLEGVLNVPLGDDLAVRFAGRHRHRDSYLEPAHSDQAKIPDAKESVITGKLLWTPGDRLRIKLSADYEHLRESDQVAFVNLNDDVPEQAGLARGGRGRTGFYTVSNNVNYSDKYNDTPPTEFIETYGGELRVDYEFDPFTLSSISGYRKSNLFDWADLDATDTPLQHIFYQEHSDLYSQEFQAVSNSNGPFKWIVGAYYMQEKGYNLFELFGQSVNDTLGVPYGANIGSMDGGPALHLRAKVKVKSFAPYAQASYEIAQGLTVTAGARYTKESKELVSNNVTVTGLGPEFSIFSEDGVKYKFNKFTPKLTVSYEPNNQTLVYATYSQGFKSGGVGTPTSAPQTRIRPEDLKAYEVGVKFNSRIARLTASAFYYDYSNLQVQVRDPITGANIVQNAATAEIYGGEIEGLFAVTPELELGAGISYLHARYKDYTGVSYGPATGSAACLGAGGAGVTPIPLACQGFITSAADFTGNPLTNAPDLTAYARATYTFDIGDSGKLALTSLLSYQNDYDHVAGGSLVEPAKALLSASLTWTSADDHYTFTVSGDNLTARKYYTYRTESSYARYGVVGAPRTVMVKAGYKF